MCVHASKKNPKKLIYVKEIATHAHLVLSLWFLSLQIQFLQPFTPFYGHFCSNRSRQRHHEFPLYHLFLYEFRNPSSVWNDNFLLFFFFFIKIWGFWSIMIESARRYKDTSIAASISLSLFLLWKIYLFLSVICFIYIYIYIIFHIFLN